MFDTLFRNATVIDGTGAPRRTANIGVKAGRLYNAQPDSPAATVIDATGKILAPGFIDSHSHGDQVVGNDYARECKTTQGITTEVAGMCGSSYFPCRGAFLAEAKESVSIPENLRANLDDFATGEGFFRFLDQAEMSCNMAVFTGHSALRKSVMGYSPEKPTPEQLEQMKALLRESMEHGSMGLSSGLFYPPSGYAEVEEMAELCKVVAEFNGIHTSHIRDESSRIKQSIEEVLEIARRSGVRSNISHHKICGKNVWGQSKMTLAMIDEANAAGTPITLDQYPYIASCTGLMACLPAYCSAGGQEALLKNLRDPAYRKTVREQMAGDDPAYDGRYRQCDGFEHIMLGVCPLTPDAVGLTVAEYARQQGKDGFEAFFDLLVDNKLACNAIYFSMCEEDLYRIISHPLCVVGTDGLVSSLHGGTHPRGWGSFPHAVRVFVREQKLFSLEEMIRKMTGLPAEIYGLKGRGVIAEGNVADLVLFDENELSDRADFAESTARCTGLELVMVAGEAVCENGRMTGRFPGKFLAAR